MQEIETALGKKPDSETSSPTTSKDTLDSLGANTVPARNKPVPANPTARQITVRFSDDVEPSASSGRRPARSQNPADALSVVDQAWGELFNGKGEPTARVEEILRGLSNYIVSRSDFFNLGVSKLG